MPKVTFNNKNRVFFNTLKKEVESYFIDHKIQKTGNWKLYVKSGILLPALLFLYFSLVFFTLPVTWAILLCALLGFVQACVGFNVMHDACHGSFSKRKWVNELFSLSANAVGASSFLWKQKHNIIHHTYTNIDGVDDDIANSPFLRQCSTQKWMPIHRFQHIYFPAIYAFTSFAWILIMDFQKYFRKKVHTTDLPPMEVKEHFIFWSTKIIYATLYIALPVFVHGWLAWLIGFMTMHIVCGITLAIVFQLAHVVEHTEFEAASTEPKLIESEWAVHQIKTTANFSPKNKILSWFVGGLNYQVEHHLFPRISHIHYPAISKIVRETCQKFELPYHQFPTMISAIGSHVRFMKMLGYKPVPVIAKSSRPVF